MVERCVNGTLQRKEDAEAERDELREQVDGLLQKVYSLTILADESFDNWYRMEFGAQASVNPDVKYAYVAGHRNALSAKAKHGK